jgi:hypothetical protein
MPPAEWLLHLFAIAVLQSPISKFEFDIRNLSYHIIGSRLSTMEGYARPLV